MYISLCMFEILSVAYVTNEINCLKLFMCHLVKIHQLVKEVESRQGWFGFYSIYSMVTLKIRSMSLKYIQLFNVSH